MKLARPAVIFAIILMTSCLLLAQSQPNTENGVKAFGSYTGSDIDTVNLQNGNVMLHIPLFSYPQRGELGLSYSVQLSSKQWQVGQFYDSSNTLLYRWMLGAQAGLTLTSSYDVTFQRGRTITTDLAGNPTEADFDYAIRTPDGAVHWLSDALANGNMVALDGSNFQFTLTRGTNFDHSDDSGVLKDSKGNTYYYRSISSDYSKIAPASGTSANLVSHVAFTNTLMPPGNNTIQIFNDVGLPSTLVDANGNVMNLGFAKDPVTGAVIITAVVDGNGNTINYASGPGAEAVPTANCPTLSTASSAYLFSFPGTNGNISPLTICYTSVTLAPTFSQPNVGPPKNDILFKSFPLGSQSAPVGGLIMPDGTKWGFSYDAYGNITTINLPTGGVISYEWTEIPLPACQDGNATAVSRAVSSRTVNDLNDPAQTWHYTWGTMQPDGTITNYVQDPNGNETAHVFKAPVNNVLCAFYETETRTYQGTHQTPTVLKTVDTHYVGVADGNDDPTNAVIFASRVVADTVTTTLPGNKISQIVRQYDGYPGTTTFGKVINEKVYDYTGLLLRETATTYQWQVDAAYLNAGLLDLPATVIVKDGSGCKMSETDYAYDESAYQNVSYEGTVGALPAGTHQGVSTPRGNLTSTTHMLFDHSQCSPAAQTAVSSHTKWYDTGEVYQHIDPLGHATTVSYDLAYGGMLATQTCSPQTSGVNHCVSGTYDFLTGLLESFTNENATTQASGNTPGDSGHTSSYSYDTSWRLTTAQAPPDPGNGSARAQTGFTFGTAYPFTIQKQKSITTAMSDSSTVYLDGVGRAYHSEHAVPGGPANVDTALDGLGQAVRVTNPYFTTSDPTYGVTSLQYDGLGRVTQTTKQDGSISTASFSANCITTADEAGAQRRSCSDALGRLIEVDEPGVVQIGAQAQATVDIGAMKSVMLWGQAAANAAGSITLRGVEQVKDIPGERYCFTLGTHGTCLDWEFYDDTFIYDYGTVNVSVNGQLFSYAYSSADSVSTIANALAGSIRASSATTDYSSVVVNTSTTPPTATIFLIARSASAAGNSITLSPSATSYDTVTFAAASFNPSVSGAALTGGIDFYAGTQVIDSGTVTISVGSFTSPVLSYGPSTANNTASQVAAALATALAGSGFTATLTPGSTVLTITDTVPRASSNGAAVQVHSVSGDPGDFPVASFNASGTLSGGADQVWTSLGNLTLYQYDGLDNLLCVEQHGGVTGTGCSDLPTSDASSPWRVRRFTYDSLGRLLTAKNPESGTISYLYDADGELLQKTSPLANQTGTATQTVSYCYDALHRVTGKGYGAQSCPLAAPVVSYAYDVGTGANAIGKLTSLMDQAGTATYSYDMLGRLSSETRTLIGANNASISKTLSYEYNLDGSVARLHYPSGAVVSYTPDSAGRITQAVDSGNGINYVTGATYDATSALTGFISGNSGTFAGITNAFTYNKRLQPVNMSANAPSQTVYSIGYDFHFGAGNNGNVFGITNYKDLSRNQTFTYDALNRLTSAQNAGTDCTAQVLQNKAEYWGNSYGYDAWGNLLQKTITKCGAENLVVTADAHNWIHASGTDYQYDAAGNMTFNATPPTQNYTYDQENRLTGAAGYTYTYDGDGNRVRKSSSSSTGTLYWYMTPGIVGESDLNGNLTDEYVFFDGERVARKSTNGVFYYFSDHLKTASLITDAAGNIKSESDFYPWGGELQFVANDFNHYKFTGKERDGETQLDYFGARYYSNGLGRFVTPDWAAKATAVPYAEFADPQSLNLYSYVRNVPTTRFDPDGHQDDKKDLPQIAHTPQQWPPNNASPLEQKVGNFLSGSGWKTDAQVDAHDAQARADWNKSQQSLPEGARVPYPEAKIGIVVPVGAMGASASGATALADEAVVVRGGLNQAENFVKGTGVTVDGAGNLQGVSVNSANGKSVEELASKGIKNTKVGVSTVKDVRAAGGTVTPSPTANNPFHCTMCNITPQQAQELFTPTIPNPSK